MIDSIFYNSISENGKLIKNKEISPVELVQAYLHRINDLEPTLNSYITVTSKLAIAQAQAAEKDILGGIYRGPLHGIPYSLKDLYLTKDIKTTFGSKLLDGFIPTYNSTIVDRFNEAGAILLGKTNMHAFAYGMTGENPDYGDMHNPWNTNLIAGGSSGGSASSVATGECNFSLGTDTGGSIRVPAALCGVVGLKPTYGILSRFGLGALSWSQDYPGPITRNVEDCAFIMDAIAGSDPLDPQTRGNEDKSYSNFSRDSIRGMVIGLPKEMFSFPIDNEIKDIVMGAIKEIENLGAIIKEISWPMIDKSMAIANTIQIVEATSEYLDLIKNQGSDIFEPIRMRFESGFFISGIDYLQAQRARVIFVENSFKMMERLDAIVTPSSPIAAFDIGKNEYYIDGIEINAVALLSQFTRPFNLNGFPAISLPCGFTSKNLPVGIQIASKPFHEKTILNIAHVYESLHNFNKYKPI